jgi:hypothetical protein
MPDSSEIPFAAREFGISAGCLYGSARPQEGETATTRVVAMPEYREKRFPIVLFAEVALTRAVLQIALNDG